MKNKLTGKQINEWAQQVNDLPDYWGYSYEWKDNGQSVKVKGEFIAKKYKAIVELIDETKAEVTIYDTYILIKYQSGYAKIDRDILTDSFLLPLININAGFHSVQITIAAC